MHFVNLCKLPSGHAGDSRMWLRQPQDSLSCLRRSYFITNDLSAKSPNRFFIEMRLGMHEDEKGDGDE